MNFLKKIFGKEPKTRLLVSESNARRGKKENIGKAVKLERFASDLKAAIQQVMNPSEPGVAEAAVLFDLDAWMDDVEYGRNILKIILARLDKNQMKEGTILAGDIPFEKDLLYAIVVKSPDKQMVTHFLQATGIGFSAKGLLPEEWRHLSVDDGNRISEAFPVVEVLEFQNGIAGDLAAERAGYETGMIQEYLAKRGWRVRDLHPPE